MLRVAIIIGSTRPNRIGEGVAKWVFDQAKRRTDAEYELIDLKDFNLPLLDEPVAAGMSDHYTKSHTIAWSRKISSFDAFVFVTPEYNHATSGALKNAFDYLYKEWNNKAAGLIGYGGMGGVRAIENLRLILAELQVASVRSQLTFSLNTDFENFKVLKPTSRHEKSLNTLFEQVISWATALKGIRRPETIKSYDDTNTSLEGDSASIH